MLNVLNLSSNSITNEGAKYLLNSIKENTSLEKLLLNCNNISMKFINEINSRILFNKAELKKQAMPRYKEEIKLIDVNENIMNDIEWKIEQIRHEKYLVENEIKNQHRNFEKIKIEEGRKYNSLLTVYNNTVNDERIIDKEIDNYDELYNEELKRTQSSISDATLKMKSLNYSISQILDNSNLLGYSS